MRKTGELDQRLGQTIIKYRASAGLSRKELATAVGITHQQMQKYEKGVNRISVARLFDISRVLKTPIIKFLELENDIPPYRDEKEVKFISEIVRYVRSIRDESKLEAIRNLVKSLASN